MEFKEKKNHYLHPDFEDIEVKDQKKPSPLALLAQTCKNIGSKDIKDFESVEKLFSTNSTVNGFRQVLKRCRSDCSSSSSSLDKEHLSPIKNRSTKIRNKEKKRKFDFIEMKNVDTSSEASFNSTSSLLTNLLYFVKGSQNNQVKPSDKVKFSQFIRKYDDNDKYIDLSKPKDYSTKRNHFNVSKAYHLESNEEIPQAQCSNNNDNYSSQTLPEKSTSTNFSDHTTSFSSSKTSPIKYCMYCGKLIPVLPILLAHIRLEHATSNVTESTMNNSFNSSASNIYDLFSKVNPSIISSQTTPNQPFSFLSDYFGSSFHRLHNLIC